MKKLLCTVIAMSLIVSNINIVFANNIMTDTEVSEHDDTVSGQAAEYEITSPYEEAADNIKDLATQSKSGNFNKSYTLTGNYANDLVSVALAQKGLTKANLGYTEAWCADFATDCARLTGMPDNIIPYNYSARGGVSYLYNYMLNNCNAQVVSNRQAGDLVFYHCPLCNSYPHVGIVIDGTYSIEGNLGGQVKQVGGSYGNYIDGNGHKVSSGQVQRIYVRPAYNNVVPPVSSVTVTTTSAQNVTETNAVVYGSCSYSGARPSEVGVYFGTSPSNMTIVGRDTITHNKNPFDMWYNLNGKGITLSPGTTYYWQCYAVCGSEYRGEVKSFTTPGGDKTPPTISNVSVTDVNKDGYTINCTISDDKNVGLIQLPTWTENNGQDDLIWHTYSENAAAGSVNVSYRINCADHNNEEGTYITHIYAWDWSSNEAVYNGDITVVNIDRTAPQISGVEVDKPPHPVFEADSFYRISYSVYDAFGIKTIKIGHWTEDDKSDIVWDIEDANLSGTIAKLGEQYIKRSAHNNKYGTYHTCVEITDFSGNTSTVTADDIYFAPPSDGDINDDNIVDITDAIFIARLGIGKIKNNAMYSISDINSDGSVNITDAILVARYGIGKIKNL